jgi:hypothetical protein
MSVLQLAEIHLGSIFTWPRLILRYLFIDPLEYRTILKLANFFYGNSVPLALAVQIFQTCNDKATDNTVHHFSYYYDAWKRCEDDIHLGIYFNMKAKKFMYINGSHNNQSEICYILSHDVSTEFGHYDTEALQKKFITSVPMYTINYKQRVHTLSIFSVRFNNNVHHAETHTHTLCIFFWLNKKMFDLHFIIRRLSYFNQSGLLL